MSIKKILLSLLPVLLLLLGGVLNVAAMDTGFTTYDMESDKKQIFLSNIDMTLITSEPEKNSIICFDVNDDGLIIIGSGKREEKLLSVYTSDGAFQYGYKFNCSGSFGVEWNGNNVIVYFVRSDVAALFDNTGNNLELKMIEDTIDNNSYWNHFVYSVERTVNKEQYVMKNDMGLLNFFATSYSQVVKTDEAGNTTTVYDVNRPNLITTIILVILFLTVFLSVLIYVIVLTIRNTHKGKNTSIRGRYCD